jgi:2-amino-4-hydroxy-6-hydroxymethyldihydropteridine diphosphokinase
LSASGPAVIVVIALGSNIGDRRAHIAFAVAKLDQMLTNLRVSSFIETEPVDVPDEQPAYVNAVVVGETTLAPEELLGRLQAIERERGRERRSFRAARTLDLDLILYGALVRSGPGLEIPHPRFRERAFVLGPLAEVAPDLIDPVSGRTARQLWEKQKASGLD